MDDLLKESDFVVLVVPLNSSTQNMIGKQCYRFICVLIRTPITVVQIPELLSIAISLLLHIGERELSLMKRTAILVNIARGGIVSIILCIKVLASFN